MCPRSAATPGSTARAFRVRKSCKNHLRARMKGGFHLHRSDSWINLSDLGIASVLQLLQHVPGQNAAATIELRAVGHHLVENVFAALADRGYVLQVDDD